MRIDRLDLLAFGPFTGLALELAQGQQGLHVVYGENETGKSSALRAIGDLLFGIAARSTDDFVHDMKALRLGGTLRTRDGKALAFVRRKGNQNVLLDPSTEAPLGDDALAPFLGGIDREEFERVFGLDHERLRKNAGALLERGDGATSAIVGSGLGIPELRHVVNALREEAEELWSARARNKPVNKTKAQLKELGREVAGLSVKGSDWTMLRDDSECAEAALHEARRMLGEIAQRRAVLERVKRIREPANLRRAARARLPAGTRVPILEPGFTKRRIDAATGIATVSAALDDALKRRNELRAELAKLPGDDPILAMEARVTELLEMRATVTKAAGDLEKLRATLGAARKELEPFAGRLGTKIDEEHIAILHARLERGIKDQNLVRAVEVARKLGDVVEQRTKTGRRCATQRERSTEALTRFQRLTGFAGSVADLAMLALPGLATIDRFVGQIRAVDEDARVLESDRKRLAKEIEDLSSQLAAVVAGGAIPAEDAIARSRAARDALWQLVRRAWLKGEDVSVAATEIDPRRSLPDAVERAIEEADRVADRLRAESDRVAKAAGLARAAEQMRARIAANEKERAAAAHRRSELDSEWSAIVRDAGVPALAPEQGHEAITARDAILALRDEQRATEDELAAFEARVTAATLALARGLPRAGAAEPDFANALERALAVLDAAELEERDGGRLIAAHEKVAGFEQRIAAIHRDAEHFATEVAEFARASAPDLAARDPHDAVTELVRRSNTSRTASTQRSTLAGQLAKAQKEVEDAELKRREFGSQLAALCREAGIADPDLLPVVEECARAERDLRREGDPDALDALEAAHNAIDVDAALAMLEPTANEAKVAVDDCTTRAIEARRAFAALDGAPAAAQKAQEIAELRTALRTQVEEHLRKAFAARLLTRGIERYREQHASPVLALAARHLGILTRGNYIGVISDVDEQGKPFVRVRREGDRHELDVDQLSDGTRDQLCLALVLGSLEHRFAHTEPMPVVLDDVLVHFDDERSLAALEALADFAKTTQVLLFTHHGRIRDQALGLGPTRDVFIHRLPR